MLSRSRPESIRSLASRLPGEWRQPRSGAGVCLGRNDDFIGWDFMGLRMFLCGKYFCYPFAKGEKNKQSKTKLGSWQGCELHNLGRECSQRTPLPHCLGSQCRRSLNLCPSGFHSKVWGSPEKEAVTPLPGADPGSREDPSGVSHHHALAFSPRGTQEHLTQPFLKGHLSVFFLSQGCLSQSLGFLVSTMEMKSSTYPDRIVR